MFNFKCDYMKIALLGFDIDGSNMGCQALVYSFLSLLSSVYKGDIEAVVFIYGDCDISTIEKKYSNIKFKTINSSLKSVKSQKLVLKEFNSCNFIFDVTYGDGFSDIYGKIWNVRTNLNKELAIKSNARFVLLPQTYGPFNSSILRKWASHIVKNADYAFTRDKESAIEFNKLIKVEKVYSTTDLAFLLPYNKVDREFESKKIGFNVSSTLWDNTHSKSIVLKTDYKQYCINLIRDLKDLGYEIHLIPHVIDINNYKAVENDVRACYELKDIVGDVIVAPSFDNPIDIKSYISGMDIFIGARMHATIGAFSSNTITIPVAYSKKFEGLYGNLGYRYIIDLRKLTTEDAVLLTKEFIEKKDELSENQRYSMEVASKEILDFSKKFKELLNV